MKRTICASLALLLFILCGCVPQPETPDITASTPSTETSQPVTEPPVTEPPVTEPPVTEPPKPKHSELYLDGFTADDIIRYFNEVCLDAEFSSGPGDASLLQKWDCPIDYYIHGNPTQKDLEVIDNFVVWLNKIEGFPGMRQATHTEYANLQIYFCTRQELIDRMGDNFHNADGAVTFWYNNNAIFKGDICYRNDIGQFIRNSVILEEIYNGLGPVQDTQLRTDSLIYAGYSTPQKLTAVDELILKLLYHPQMRCGMNAEACAAVIRSLYY